MVDNCAYAGSGTCSGGPNADTEDLICNFASSLEPLMGTSANSLVVGVCLLTPGSSTSYNAE